MINVTTINKTIIVWNNLSKEEAKDLTDSLSNILSYYASKQTDKYIPIPLKDDYNYLAIINKNGYNMLSVIKDKTKNPTQISCSPIINGDKLYESISILRNYKRNIDKRINIISKMSSYEWVNLSITQAVDSYLISPNINPENFVKSLTTGNLPETYKKFLSNVGIALESIEKEKQIIINNETIEIER